MIQISTGFRRYKRTSRPKGPRRRAIKIKKRNFTSPIALKRGILIFSPIYILNQEEGFVNG